MQAIGMYSEYKKCRATSLVMRHFLGLLGEPRDCAINVFSMSGLGLYSNQVFSGHGGALFMDNKFDSSLITTNPGFVDPAMGNYHIRFDSPAVDRCSAFGNIPEILLGTDFDADERSVDISGVDNNSIGLPGDYFFDVGADEYIDIIFVNGFE